MRIRRFAPFLLAVAWLSVPTPARAAPPLDATTRDFDQLHLRVSIEPHVKEGWVDGLAALTFASLADPLRVLRLHCEETDVLSVIDPGTEPLVFRVADDILSITLGEPLPRGQESEVRIRYRSKPTQGLFFHCPTGDCPDMPLEMYSQGEGTDNRRWIPCYDEPDDRLTVAMDVKVPTDLKTVSNGTLTGSTPSRDGKTRQDHWRLEQRIPTYLISLIVGRFETITEKWKDVPLEYNGQIGRTEEIRTGFASTPAIMAFFVDYIGHPFPYPRYAQTTVWDFVYGGMENAGATTMNMRLLHTPDAKPNYSPDNLVAHEMAHQWFGDLLTCRTWDHLWLNEGFATYFADLFFEHRDGPEEFAIDRFEQNRRYMEGTPRPETLNLKPSPRGDVPLELFGGKQYNRGAAILHQLRIELGDDLFREGVRRYVKDHQDEAVVTEDLRHSMEAAAGRDLKWFFDQWVYGAGYPVLDVSYAFAKPPGGGKPGQAVVTVVQTQAAGSGQPEAFRLRVPIRFATREGAVNGVLDLRQRRQTFTVPIEGAEAPRYLRVGVGGGTFAKASVKQDRAAWAAMLASEPDPTARMQAAETLPDWPDATTVEDLARALAGDASYAVRAEAADALGRIDGPAPLGALLAALSDGDARVRESVAEALGGRTRDEAGKVLTTLATSDPSPYVRAAAALSVGRVHADGAFETLQSLLSVDSHREVVRKGAFLGFRALGDARAIELAKPLLVYNWRRGDHHGMRQEAMNMVLALAPDEPSSHAVVVSLLDDPYFRMREWAAEAAGKYLVRSAEARLKTMADSDPHGGAKRAAKEALERLAAKR
jgi:aminopeptidase N